jgi:hypothetical protein
MPIMNAVWHWFVNESGIFVGVVSALFGLFSEQWKNPRWKWLAIAGIAVGMLLALAKDRQDDRDQLGKIQSMVKEIDSNVQIRLQPLEVQISQALGQQGRKPDQIQSTSLQDAADMLSANSYLDDFLRTETPERRQELTICVFDHFKTDVNFTVVQARLLKLAANVKSCKAKVDWETNSVWYSSPGDLPAAKAAALLAISAGVHIRQICQATIVKTPNLIQIGALADADINKMPILTALDVENLTEPICEQAYNVQFAQ